MRKYFLILLLLISAAVFSQTAPNIIYGKDVIIQTRDTSSAELTIKNSTRNVLGYFKNIGGGKGQYTLIPQVDITALPDSLLARYTKTQADARFKSISYIPDWVDITGKPANFSTTYALSNDIQDSLLNKVSRNGSYANPSWITSLDYSKLTGTVPTWNQNTTGNAATVTNGVYTTGSYSDPSWITGLAWSKISGAPAFITGINSSMVTTALGYTPENAANKGIANGYADLDAGGKIPASRIDFWQTGQTFVVASQSAMLAVSGANIGALAIRTDQNKNYRLIAQPASTLANWQVLLSPDAPVQSVNGFTGNVNLLTTHISEGSNYWWTAARSRAAQSLTVSGSSGSATYDNTTGVLNIPTYTLAGLGGQPALSGTGFVKISGTTITYDNSTYLTSYTETDPTIYAWAKATTKPSYSWGEITGTVPTWNQNTTGSAATLSAVLASNLGGAGSVSGLLKANGSGVVSAAVAGTDYVIPSALSGYLPLTAGSGQSLSGDLYVTKDNPKIFLNDNAGGSQNNYSINSNFGIFNLNDETAGGASVFSYGGGSFTMTGVLNGTSLSMSGGGVFGGSATVASGAFGVGGLRLKEYTATDSRNWIIANDVALFGDLAFQQSTTQTGSTYNTRFYINPSGNVGIGTTSPFLSKLHVVRSESGANPTPVLRVGNSGIGFTSKIIITDETTNDGIISYVGSNQTLTFGLGGAPNILTLAASTGAATFSSSVTASGFIRSGSSDSYFLLGGGGHVATSTYATTASLSSYVNTTGNQLEIGGNKSFLGAVEVLSLKTTGGPGTPGVLKFGGKTNDTVFTGGSSYVLPVNIDGTTYYIRLWAGVN